MCLKIPWALSSCHKSAPIELKRHYTNVKGVCIEGNLQEVKDCKFGFDFKLSVTKFSFKKIKATSLWSGGVPKFISDMETNQFLYSPKSLQTINTSAAVFVIKVNWSSLHLKCFVNNEIAPTIDLQDMKQVGSLRIMPFKYLQGISANGPKSLLAFEKKLHAWTFCNV